MSSKLDYGATFLALVAAHDEGDVDAIERIASRMVNAEKVLRVAVEEETGWMESMIDGYSEFPVVTQVFKVYAGDNLVYEGERVFGCEIEDPTHTGLAGRWVTIRIDDGKSAAESALEELGMDIEWPDSLEPR